MEAMPKYVAFLRAINVGGHVVKMEQLKRLFEELKLKNVETFIASGNVIFDSTAAPKALEAKIEKALQAALGYAVETFLRTPEELARIVEAKPFGEVAAGETVFISFLAEEPSKAAVEKLMALSTPVDAFAVIGRELWWLRRSRDSELVGSKLEKALGMKATARNITTVRKLAAKYA